jgi:hypothetical protein
VCDILKDDRDHVIRQVTSKKVLRWPGVEPGAVHHTQMGMNKVTATPPVLNVAVKNLICIPAKIKRSLLDMSREMGYSW